MTPRLRLALGLILAVALALRLWGIRYGLPWLFYFHDEPQVVLRALRFGTGDLDPHFFIWPGTLLIVLAFVSFAGLFLVGRAAGWWSGKEGFAAAYFRDPSAFYLLPRLQSVVFGAWTVWLAFALGRAADSAPVGVAAALGLAVNAMAAHYAHLAHPVTAMTAFTTLGLLAAVRLAHEDRPRHLILGAVAAGFGITAQYHAGLLAAPLGVALLYRIAEARPAERGRWMLRALGAAALALLIVLAVSPFIVLDWKTFRADLAWITVKTGGAAGHRGLAEGLTAFARECLRPALGVPLLIAAGLGAALALVRRRRADLVLLAFCAAYALLAARASILNDRYAIPLIVPALIFAASGVAWLLERVRVPAARAAWAPAAAVAVLVAPLALALVETDVTMTRGDTRIESLRWFESHVPTGARVAIDMQRFWNSASPPLAEDSTRLAARLAEAEGGFTGGGHSNAYVDYYRYQLAHPRTPAYDLRSTDLGDSARTLADYRAAGVAWAVVSEEAIAQQRGRAAAGDSSGLAYYDALARDAEQVAEFRPERWRRLGPVIRVYRLDAAAAGARR
jgi:hypothetical protein